MDKVLAARRLSAALGKSFSAERVKFVAEDGGLVMLDDKTSFMLARGNAVFDGEQWHKNGKVWDLDATGDEVRSFRSSSA